MTMSIIGRCPREGVFGVAIASSPLAVVSRCAFLRPDVGVVATQAYTNPALGPLGLSLLEDGLSPEAAIAEIRKRDPWPDHRQVAILDRGGRTAVFTGNSCLDLRRHIEGPGFAAQGNYLTSREVVDAMADAWRSSENEIIEERLLRGIEAARDAGGDRAGASLSAGVIVSGAHSVPRTDLRVDLNLAPGGRDALDDLRTIFNRFRPLIPYYEERVSNPFIEPWTEWLAKQARR